MIHVVIPVHNRLELTKKCIQSLKDQSFKDWCAYVIDDGSSDGTFEWVKSLNYSNVYCFKGSGSLWWTGSMQLGVEHVLQRASEDDYLMALNNDVFLTERAIEILFNSIQDRPKSIFSSISISEGDNRRIMSSGAKMISWILNISYHPFYGRSYDSLDNFNSVEVDMLNGRSVIYPIEVFKKNKFDFKRFPQYGGDNEFSYRIKKLGYSLNINPKSIVYVQRSETGLNPMDRSLNLSEKMNSLFSIKSVNNIFIRARFALVVPPIYAIPTYFLIALMKILIQLLLSNTLIKLRK